MTRIDFLAIGDITTDAFIRIKDARVHCNINQENCELCFRFGDKIPFEDVTIVKAVGNSSNAAVSAARLGLHTMLASDVGDDQNGKEMLGVLDENGVSTDLVKIHKDISSNYHYVLWYDVERTILVKHHDYPRHFQGPKETPAWIYLSSIGENSEGYHDEIADYLEAHPDVKMAFQPGTFQMKMGTERLSRIYSQTEVFFCNVEEAQRILKVSTRDIKELSKGFHDLGTKIVSITDGVQGAYASDGKDVWFMPIYPQEAFERTGAGDAFASTFTAALALGKSVEEAIAWGPINSMSVVQSIGAREGLLSREKLLEYLEKAPADYTPKKI